jgi:hypothetical protein
MQLLGEEGCVDADDLARTALENQEVTNADVVGWDRDGVWVGLGLRRASYSNVNFFLFYVLAMVVMMISMTSADDAFSSMTEAMSEGVVMTWDV